MSFNKWLVLLLAPAAFSCRSGADSRLQQALDRHDARIVLPAGVTTLQSPLVIPPGVSGVEIVGDPAGSTLAAGSGFRGRALIYGESVSKVTIRDITFDGNRQELSKPISLPPSNRTFSEFYPSNGVVLERTRNIRLENLQFKEVTNFPVLISACSDVVIEQVRISDSGSTNAQNVNNTSGGILLEEGTSDFAVRECAIRRVRGNGIWTHSNMGSPRNSNGRIEMNDITEVARDAIQIGHATHVQVRNNRGSRIGYPLGDVSLAGDGTPVALDSAGNVDDTNYLGNSFEDVNGECINLDGFHDGTVAHNRCINTKPAAEYPYGHYGIVFGNSNPDMQPANVSVVQNEIAGTGYGGVFLIGSHQRIVDNRFLDLNRAHCTGDMSKPRCNYAPQEPGMLRSGIYLGKGAARPAATVDNVVTGNTISGFGMDKWCVDAAPGVSLKKNVIARNRCSGQP